MVDPRISVRLAQAHLSPREKDKANAKRYRDKHPERVLAGRRKTSRRSSLRHKFDMSLRQYDYLLKKQRGGCAICGYEPTGTDRYRGAKHLAVDHDHTTGKIRGLLCDNCNRGLGQLKDSFSLLFKAMMYLRSNMTEEEIRSAL